MNSLAADFCDDEPSVLFLAQLVKLQHKLHDRLIYQLSAVNALYQRILKKDLGLGVKSSS